MKQLNKNHLHMHTSTIPSIIPAPIVPTPAIRNGIETCIVVCHHGSSLAIPLPVNLALPPSSPPFSDPGSGSDDATDVVVIEVNEPVVEGGKTANFSLSLSVKTKTKKQKNLN